jgi:hypothetical protein
VAKFKDIAGISRKYAIPLLEFFDRERITGARAIRELSYEILRFNVG